MDNSKILKHCEILGKICKYNLENNTYKIFDNCKEVKTEGIFTLDNGNLLFVSIIDKNINLVINEQRYNLEKLNFEFKFEYLASGKGHFKFVVDNHELYNTIYNVPDCVNYWESEEDLDFFQIILKYNK